MTVHKNEKQQPKSCNRAASEQRRASFMHGVWLLPNILTLFLFYNVRNACKHYRQKKITHICTGMLCQHSSITEGGNGTASLLTGKSCHSLTKHHNSSLLKMDWGSIRRFHTDYWWQSHARHLNMSRSEGAHTHTHTSRHAQTDSCKETTSGVCLCSNTECEQLLDGRRGRKLVARPTGVSENTRSQTREPGEVDIGQEWRAKPPPLSEFFQFILAKCES